MNQGEIMFEKNNAEAHKSGAKIRKIRISQGKTAVDLANAINVTSMAVRNYEIGNRKLKDELIETVADYFKVCPEALKDRQIESRADAIQILFELEDSYGIIPFSNVNAGIITHDAILAAAVQKWSDMYDRKERHEISQQEYTDWKNSFPSRTGEILNIDVQQKSENNYEKVVRYRMILKQLQDLVVENKNSVSGAIRDNNPETALQKLEQLETAVNVLVESEMKKL